MNPELAAANLIVALSDYGEGLASKLLPIGLGLAVALLTIKVAWEGLQVAFGARSVNDGIANLLLTVAIGATVIMVLAPGAGGLYTNFIGILKGGFDSIARALTGSNYDTSQLTAMTDPLFSVITKLWGVGEKLLSNLSALSPIAAVKIVVQVLMLLLFAVFYMVIFGVAVVTFMLASIVFSIGVALGPVLIPWVLFKPLEAAMDRWFWFIVTAGFQKIMILVILLMGAKATEKVMDGVMAALVASAEKGEVFFKPDPYLVLFIVGVLLLMLILKSESITNAILPGHGAIGIAGMLKGAAAVGRGASGLAKGAANVGTATAKGAAALASTTKNAAQFGQQVTGAAARLSTSTGMSVPKATAKVIGRKIADSKVGAAASAGADKVKAWNANPFKNYKAHGNPSSAGPPPPALPSTPGNTAREKIAAAKAQTRSRR